MPGSSRCLFSPPVPDPQKDAGWIEETFTFCGSQKTENGCLRKQISLNQHSKPRFLLVRFPKKIWCHIESHMDCYCSFVLSKYIQNPALSFHLYCDHLGQVPIISYLDYHHSPWRVRVHSSIRSGPSSAQKPSMAPHFLFNTADRLLFQHPQPRLRCPNCSFSCNTYNF